MTPLPASQSKSDKYEIGWREVVALPELGIVKLQAKIDTGARTSALHAVDLEPYTEKGANWIAFNILLSGSSKLKRCTARIADERKIKNTSGVPMGRYIVRTMLVLGPRQWCVELSLANRSSMKFDLILGRTAIRNRRLLVDPGRSFLAGPPSKTPETIGPAK